MLFSWLFPIYIFDKKTKNPSLFFLPFLSFRPFLYIWLTFDWYFGRIGDESKKMNHQSPWGSSDSLDVWLRGQDSNLRPSGNTNSFFCVFYKLYNVRKALFHRRFTDIMSNSFFCIVLYFLPFLYVWLTFDWYLTDSFTWKKTDFNLAFFVIYFVLKIKIFRNNSNYNYYNHSFV